MHPRSIHRINRRIARNVYRCVYIQLSICTLWHGYPRYFERRERELQPSLRESLSLSLSLFHAVTVCRRTPRHRRGEEEVRPCGRIGRHVGETAIKKKPAKAVEWKSRGTILQRVQCESFLLDYVNHYEKRRCPFIRGRSRMRKRMQFLLPLVLL